MIEISISYRVTVLIDADNAQLTSIDIKHILEFAKYFGRLQTSRAYGDWNQSPLKAHCKKYDEHDIERIQVERLGKNATDYYILMDMGALVEAEPGSIFILVSGDHIFASTVQFLSNKSGMIIGIGNKASTSTILPESFSLFYFLEDIEQELIEIKSHYPIPPDEVRAFFWRLLTVYDNIASKDWRWVSYSELGAKLHEKFVNYEKEFGQYSLSEWVRHLDKGSDAEFESDAQMVRRIDINPEYTRRYDMLNAYREVQKDSRAHLSHFGKKLREIARNYEERFGSKKLTEWIQEYPDDFRIEEDYVMLKRPW